MKLEVIIPVRNNTTNIFRILNSLDRESRDEPRVNITIVDDASTDETNRIIKDFVSLRKGRFQAVDLKERRFAGGARNEGVKASAKGKSDFVCFFDSDDDIEEGALGKILAAMEGNYNADLICWGFTRKMPKGDSVWLPTFENDFDFVKMPVAPWAKAVRRDMFVPFDEGVYCEDCVWWFRQADVVDPKKVVAICDKLYVYDRRADCFSRTLEMFVNAPMTLEYLAYSNMLPKNGFNDRAPSDCLRNLAAMYDVRHELKREHVKAVWAHRFHTIALNALAGRWSF